MRICSLLPGATEIAFALGLAEEIAGVSHECDFPPAARDKPVMVRSVIDSTMLDSGEIDRQVGNLLREHRSLYMLDEEKFKQSQPDVILTQGLCDVCALDYEDVARAARSLIPEPQIVSLNPHCLADILNDVLRVGEATQRRQQAKALVQQLTARIESIRSQTARSSSGPRVACLEWFDPLYAAGHWVPEMVQIAGGADVLGSPGKPSAKVDWQNVVASSPDLLILMPCGFDVERTIQESSVLNRLEGWNELTAVRSGRVFAVNGNDYFSRPGPRLLDGLEILSHIFQAQFDPAAISSHAVKRVNV
ncbi:MAG: ABC transporter substrate-binding protein [Deltaproteobacteria bacterium]|nr:ABC transporter substrate-binding protein [Deltaproteobacteria bacterium]